MICPSCKAENDATAESCFTCGKGLSSVIQGAILGNRYEILRFIGKGGMGMIYKAHDQVLDEVVALKTLRPHIAGDHEMLRRFVAEIKLARKIRHRNVCAIHDYGEAEGLVYISMEFIDGQDLKDVIQAHGALEADDAFEATIQIAKGLEAIHDVGVVHRDLKTHNLMRDKRGTIKLLDFGIAKEQNAEKGLTGTGQLVGTPEYMSPEQVRGQVVDHRSDLYALAIVAFECFTGDVPFKGDTPIITLFKHLEEPPPLTGPRAKGLPEPLLPVLAKGLAKEPGERFQSASEFIDALRQARSATFPQLTPTPMPFRAPPVPSSPPAAPTPTMPQQRLRTPAPVPAPPPQRPPATRVEVPAAPERTEESPRPAPPPKAPPAAPAPRPAPPPSPQGPPTVAQPATPPPATERHPSARKPPTRPIARPSRPEPGGQPAADTNAAPPSWTPAAKAAPAATALPPPRSSGLPLPLILGGGAALLVVGVSLALVSSWSREPAARATDVGAPQAPPPVEEVVQRVENADQMSMDPVPVEEQVVLVPGQPPPTSAAAVTAPAEAAPAAPVSSLAAPAPTQPTGRPVLSLRPEQVTLDTPKVAAGQDRLPAPTLPRQTQPPASQPATTSPPAAPVTTQPALPPPARGHFEPGQTRLTSGRAASGPKGFDMTGLEVERSTEFLGSIEFEAEPAQPRPGQAHTLRIYLLNAGEKDVKLRSLTLTTVAGGDRTPVKVEPVTDRLDSGARGLIYTYSGVWPASGDWGLRAEIVTTRDEKATNYVRWRPAS